MGSHSGQDLANPIIMLRMPDGLGSWHRNKGALADRLLKRDQSRKSITPLIDGHTLVMELIGLGARPLFQIENLTIRLTDAPPSTTGVLAAVPALITLFEPSVVPRVNLD